MPRKKAPSNFRPTSETLSNVVKAKEVRLILPNAHPKQYEFITALDTIPGSRFIVGACGTKWGKTYGSTIALTRQAWNNRDSLNWWVAPTYTQSKMAYYLIKRLLPKDTFVEYKADLTLVLLEPNGVERSTIVFKSGDNPDSLRGFGVHFFIMDEAARCPYESFVSLLTTVTQTRGKGLIVSTPKGRGWFYDVYQWGEKYDEDGLPRFENPKDDPHPDWFSIRMPTWQNPTVELDSIREMKRNLPEDVFQQEVAAKFLVDSAGVFRGIKDCIRGSLQDPLPGHQYVMGVDLARLKDYSVLIAMDRVNRNVVYFERFNQISWEVQYKRIIEAAKRYNNALVLMDSTGIGDPIVETIKGAGINVEPYKITGTTAKQQLIDKLRVNIENQRISFPFVPVLKRELEAMEYEVADNGRIKFISPTGVHDDTVISLALANWGIDREPWVYRYRSVRGI